MRTKATRRRKRIGERSPAPVGAGPLARRLARALAELDAERRRHARQLAAVRGACDRRLAAVVRELASLRHHEARADALARLLTEREAALVARVERIAVLESLLRDPADMR